MVDRRSLLKAGAAGLAGVGLLGTASGSTVWRLLVVRNPGDEKQRVRVVVDGRVALGSEASRDEDTARNEDGRGFIEAVLDPGATDSFWVDGDVERVRWTGSEPELRLNGRRLDLDDYDGGPVDGDDDDGDDDDEEEYPSRIQFVATGDDLEAFFRASGRVEDGDTRQEIRVRLEEGRVRTVRYSGNVRELRVANGEVDVDVSQQ
ncbi:hypothetical protein [Halobacterium yunchengense]|uniref:hypothetical protein n=1 Tax=Halobacterium yunchengense TaxID=3108497 RepID=UPI00300922A2